jgi:hypothetical protein
MSEMWNNIRADRTKIRRVSKFCFEFIRALVIIYLRSIGTHCNKSNDTQLSIIEFSCCCNKHSLLVRFYVPTKVYVNTAIFLVVREAIWLLSFCHVRRSGIQCY